MTKADAGMMERMLVTTRLVADLSISREFIAQYRDALQAGADRLIRTIIGTADKSAYRVRPESVYITRTEEELTVTLHGLWSPTGAHLIGGEYDGDTVNITRGEDGFPPRLLVFPCRSDPWREELSMSPTRPTSNPEYRRLGIDPIEDQWVYQLVRGAS